MNRSIWKTWHWREDPEAPRMWEHPERMVVVVDHPPSDPDITSSIHRFLARDGLMILIEGTDRRLAVAHKQRVLRGSSDGPPGAIPALRVERQTDLSGDAVRALCAVQAEHRALAISPREAIDIGPHINPRGHSWLEGWTRVINDHGLAPDLVVVQGSTGPDAWPMHPAWVRALRDECEAAGVAFAFTGWGAWAPASRPRRAVRDEDRCLVRWNGETHPASASDIILASMADVYGFERVGADRSGRMLDGREHLALPEGL